MSSVVERCAAALSAAPDAVLPAERIGARRPAGMGDLPFVVLTLQVESSGRGALGRELRFDEDFRTRRGDVVGGVLELEAWAATSDAVLALTAGVEQRFSTSSSSLRANGFTRLTPASLGAAEQSRHEPAVGTPFTVWRQAVTYAFTCEVEPVEPDTEGGLIARIDVATADPRESFSIRADQ